LKVTLADSGDTLHGKVITCLTAVTATNPMTLKTSVTYELRGVSGPPPVPPLEEDAKKVGDTILYSGTFFFYK